MKEPNIEELVVMYGRLSKWMKVVYPTLTHEQQMEAESFFPSLKESEDERIMACIGMCLTDIDEQRFADFNTNLKECSDWLEKQGEHAKFRDSIQVGDKLTLNEDGVLVNLSQLNRVGKKEEKQGDQKSAWSEEDDKMLENITSSINEESIREGLQGRGINYSLDTLSRLREDLINWVKTFKDRVLSQPKQEWSEEDEKMYKVVHNLAWESYKRNRKLDIPTFGTINHWFKTLKDRVISQPKLYWKPSDEEMLNSFLHKLEVCDLLSNKECIWIRNKFKALKDRVRPKQEWSEEDKNRFTNLISLVKCSKENDATKVGFIEFINKLKSLSLKTTWKPSDEEIEALEHFVRSVSESGYASPYDNNTKLLNSLLFSLKKLK